MQENWRCFLTSEHRSYSVLRSGKKLSRTCHSSDAAALHITPHGNNHSNYPADHSRSNDPTIVHTTPPKQESSMAAGRVEIMNFTKRKVLPNPDSESLTNCNDNSPTRVLWWQYTANWKNTTLM